MAFGSTDGDVFYRTRAQSGHRSAKPGGAVGCAAGGSEFQDHGVPLSLAQCIEGLRRRAGGTVALRCDW
jgi:hypothetical protein